MSNLGLKNLIQPREWGHMVRTALMLRDEPTFFDDSGEEPLTPEFAFVEGLNLGYRQQPPVMGADCLRAFNSGLAIGDIQSALMCADDGYSDWEERQSEREWDESPRGQMSAAWWDREYAEIQARDEQIEAMWAEVEDGPLFMSRVRDCEQVRGTW